MSGFGSVTDGLILRVTTEGLFIDDDVRGVPQREWDVKAWTLKQVEAWCPQHCLHGAAPPNSGAKSSPNLLHKMAGRSRAADRGSKALTATTPTPTLTEMLRSCKNCCRLGQAADAFLDADTGMSAAQTGAWTSKALHLLRATVRDQDGKRYLFVLGEEEGWKVSMGLQRLRRGRRRASWASAAWRPPRPRRRWSCWGGELSRIRDVGEMFLYAWMALSFGSASVFEHWEGMRHFQADWLLCCCVGRRLECIVEEYRAM